MDIKKIKKWFKKHKLYFKWLLVIIIGLILFMLVYHTNKPLPEGISFKGEVYNVAGEDVEFIYDLTYENSAGEVEYDQNIFNRIYEVIDNAERFIVIDMFLWSLGKDEPYRDLGQEMADHLVAKKRANPEIEIVVITDYYNSNYNSFKVKYFEEMEAEGIDVVWTDMDKVRDSNLLYSPFYRTFFQILGKPKLGWVQTPLYPEKTSFRSFFKLLNFKVNHRKVMIADSDDKVYSFVISANPSGASSQHSNVGVLIKDEVYKDIYEAEKAVAKFSGFELPELNFDFVEERVGEREDIKSSSFPDREKDVSVQFLTEGKIEQALLKEIDDAVEGDEIKITMFYFSDRDVVKSLLDASKRGVDIEIILDPSKYGFGMNQYGVPTRLVADELVKKSDGKIKVKFYNTHEEEFHSKMIVIIKDDKVIIFIGSANLTRRNLDDLNLESDVKIISDIDEDFVVDILEYFDLIWNNKNENVYTVDVDFFGKPSLFRKIQYRFQEATGFGIF